MNSNNINVIQADGFLSDIDFNAVVRLDALIFADRSFGYEALSREMQSKPKLVSFLAFSNDQLVGFKIGYEKRSARFYSWIGGVAPDYRKLGIASEMMKLQHLWAKEIGYNYIETVTENDFKPMLLLNLQSGFDIIGTYINSQKKLKIILEKNFKQSVFF